MRTANNSPAALLRSLYPHLRIALPGERYETIMLLTASGYVTVRATSAAPLSASAARALKNAVGFGLVSQ